MSEEKIVERIEANEEAAKEHKKLFDSKLDRLLERIEQLQEDLRIVIRFSHPNIVEQAHVEANITAASPWAPHALDPAFQEKCRKFVERYGSQ
jgi:hypothetical protein